MHALYAPLVTMPLATLFRVDTCGIFVARVDGVRIAVIKVTVHGLSHFISYPLVLVAQACSCGDYQAHMFKLNKCKNCSGTKPAGHTPVTTPTPTLTLTPTPSAHGGTCRGAAVVCYKALPCGRPVPI